MKPDRNKLLLWLDKEINLCQEEMKKVEDRKIFVQSNGKRLIGIPAFIILLMNIAPSLIFWILQLSVITSNKKRRDVFSRGESQLSCISDSSSSTDDADDYAKDNLNCFYNTTLLNEQYDQTGQKCDYDEIQSYANRWQMSSVCMTAVFAISIITFIIVFFKLFGSITYYDTSYHRNWADAQIAIYLVSSGFPVQVIIEDFYSKKREAVSIIEGYTIQAICNGAKENTKKEEASSFALGCTNICIALMISLESGVPGTLSSLYMNYFLGYVVSVTNTCFFILPRCLFFLVHLHHNPFYQAVPKCLASSLEVLFLKPDLKFKLIGLYLLL